MRRCGLALLALGGCRSHAAADAGVPPVVSAVAAEAAPASSSPAPPPAPPRPAPAVVTTDWCIDGLSVLDEDVCYVLPPFDAGRSRQLLVYLHGIVPPIAESSQKRTFETVVLRASTRAGVAALLPRGRRGLGPAQSRDWWAWPTTSEAMTRLTPAIVARWVAAKRKLEAIAGAPFDRTYLAGSSNGAYFLAALAVGGELPTAAFPVDGFGAMSGGGAGAAVAPRRPGDARPPFYVGYGAYDADSRGSARALVTFLERAGWPVRAAEHPFGHGANEVYLDEAFEFWNATGARE